MMASREQARTAENADAASRIAGSGLRVSKPSDDPVAYARRLVIDSRISDVDARGRATSAALDDLVTAESTLATAGDLLSRAREIATQMANGTINAAQRATAATELGVLRDSLISQANVRGTYGYLFSGTKTNTPAFDPAATYQGNLESTRVEIGPGVSISTSASGSQAFTAAGGTDVFAALSSLQTALTTNNIAGITTSIGLIDTSERQVVAERARVGQIVDTLSTSKDEFDTSNVALKAARAATVEADSASAYTDLVRTQTSYQQALEVTKRILAMSAFER